MFIYSHDKWELQQVMPLLLCLCDIIWALKHPLFTNSQHWQSFSLSDYSSHHIFSRGFEPSLWPWAWREQLNFVQGILAHNGVSSCKSWSQTAINGHFVSSVLPSVQATRWINCPSKELSHMASQNIPTVWASTSQVSITPAQYSRTPCGQPPLFSDFFSSKTWTIPLFQLLF